MILEEFIDATNRAPNPEALFRIFMGKLETMGFDRVVYSYMTDSPLLKKKAEHGVVRNYPNDWMKYYHEQNYVNYDPVYRTALVTRRPFSWKELMEKQNLNRKQKKVMAEAEEAGLKDGVALSIHGPMGETIGMGLASSMGGVDISKNALSEIYLLAHQFHLCYSGFLSDDFPFPLQPEEILSDRERDILIWCAKNKSTSLISGFLGVSKKTVEFHLSNIYKKLQVGGRMEAVLKAFHLGLISL